MADSIVRLSVEDSSFNAKIKAAAKSFADFGKNVASAGVDAFGKFARGVETASGAFKTFNAALKANALVFVATTAIQASQAIGEMIGDWISGASDAEEAQRRLNEELENTASLIKEIDRQSKFNERLARAAGASTSEILSQRLVDAQNGYQMAQAERDKLKGNKNASQEAIEKAEKMVEAAYERVRRANEDIIVDNAARINKTGEYSVKGGSRSGGSHSNTTSKPELTEMQTLQKQIQELEQEYIKLGGITTEDANKRRGEIQSEIHANETRINQIKLLGEQAHGKLLGGVGVSSEGLGANSLAFDGNALQKNLDYVLEQIKVKPIVVPIEAATDNVKKLQDTARTTAKVVGTIGQAFNAIEDPAGKVAAVVAQAIANVALAYSDALAKTTAEKFNIWSFIAASASAMISMGTTIASIHSATGYAQGGMIKGNSYSGDNVGGLVDGSQLVGLNAGELVLTKAMQGSLAQSLQNNGQTIRVVGKLSGKDLFICAENWSKSAGHGEFVTW